MGVSGVSIAQQGGSTTTVTISNGSILSSENCDWKKGFHPSNKTYDEHIVGVFRESKPEETTATKAPSPIISEGVAYVKYNSENGQIKKGDLITTSSTAGEGMKATQSGMVIGIALEDASGTSGLIKIRVLIQYVKQ